MAVLKERLNRKNSSGTYDVIYLETSSSVVIMADGTTAESKIINMQSFINSKAASSHGTHVSFTTTTPKMDGTAAVGSATTVSRSDHVHPTDTSRAASSHNHGAGNITSGTLAIARGGTGLTDSPSMLTNLASTTAANVLVASPRPGVTGTLPLANGGTGKTTAPLASYALISGSTALAATGLDDTDVIPIGDVSSATGKKVTLADLASYMVSKGYIRKPAVVGDTISWADYTWIIVHVENGMTYLALKNIYSLTQFGQFNKYAGSTLASVAKTFENSLPAEALAMCQDVTVEGVTAKVFVPTHAQCKGGFEYYSSNANRIAYYNNAAQYWWTVTTTSLKNLYLVASDGSFYPNGNCSGTRGFRPHVALTL